MHFISHELEDVFEIYLTLNLLEKGFNSDFNPWLSTKDVLSLNQTPIFLFEKKLKMSEITGTLGQFSALDRVEKLNLTKIRIDENTKALFDKIG